MKSLYLASFLTVCVAFSAASGEELNKSWSVGANPQLRVEAGDASIAIEGGDTGSVRAKLVTDGIRIGSGGVELVEHQMGDTLDLRIQEPNNHSNWGHRSVHLSLVVPRNLALSVKTGDGSIRLANLGGKVRAGTGDGSIEGSQLNGLLDARSGDGSMHLDGVFSDLHLHTGDGSIDLKAGAGSKVDMGWELSSGDGSISLRIPRNLAADLDLRTGDGHISTALPITVSEFSNRREMHGKLNGGGASVAVRTGDGSINIAAL